MVNRDHLIAYLLHQMPDSARLDFAEQWFTDPALGEQLSTVEAELFDAYVRGELPRKQRAAFERYFLNSDANHPKLEFAAALRGVLSPPASRPFPWLAVVAAALVALMAGGTFWFGLENRGLRQQIARLQQNATPPEGGVYSVSLLSDGLRGAPIQRSVALPADARILRLDLDLTDVEQHETYAAVLSRSGRLMWKEEPLSPDNHGGLSLTTVLIPANLLTTAAYNLTLESDGRPIAEYPLTIVRKIQ